MIVLVKPTVVPSRRDYNNLHLYDAGTGTPAPESVAHDPFATEARNHEGVRGPVSDETATSNRFFTDDPGAEPRRVSEVPRNGVHRIWRSLARRRNIVVIVLIAAYVGWFIHLNLESYYTYGEPPFDLAVFDQGMWLISHFHIPFDTVMGRNLFGDHSSFVLYLFAPFYRLFPEPQGLLVFQTLLLAAPAIPIYVLARKYIKSTVIATALVATYLLSPLVQQGNLDQFHPEAFQVFFVSVAIYAAIESRSGPVSYTHLVGFTRRNQQPSQSYKIDT